MSDRFVAFVDRRGVVHVERQDSPVKDPLARFLLCLGDIADLLDCATHYPEPCECDDHP
jgi:hypothetical protein